MPSVDVFQLHEDGRLVGRSVEVLATYTDGTLTPFDEGLVGKQGTIRRAYLIAEYGERPTRALLEVEFPTGKRENVLDHQVRLI